MVRPRKDKDERRDEIINIRVTVAEKRILTKAAERDLSGLSHWLRRLGLQTAKGAR